MAERQLNEQWVEKGSDGKMHMYKAVEGPCERCDISYTCNLSVDCHMGRGLIAKDLGILNDDGCLPCPFCGSYPELFTTFLRNASAISCTSCGCTSDDEYKSLQQAIDAWNRRA